MDMTEKKHLKSILEILKIEKNEILLLWRHWMMVMDRQRWLDI